MNFNLLATNLYAMQQFMDTRLFELISFIGDCVIWAVGHVFLSIAVYTLAKRFGCKKLWLSFIPFFNLIPLGAVVGKTTVWGMKIKNIGVWVCITGIATFVINLFLNIGYYVNIFYPGDDLLMPKNAFWYSWFEQSITPTAESFNLIYVITSCVGGLFSLAKIFFEVSLIFMVFRLFKPQSYFMFSLLSVFVSPLFGILLFVCRNNPKHVIIRAQPPQNFYGGYGGYYSNSQRPQNFTNAEESKKQKDEPFPEFNDEDKGSDSNDDGFFN